MQWERPIKQFKDRNEIGAAGMSSDGEMVPVQVDLIFISWMTPQMRSSASLSVSVSVCLCLSLLPHITGSLHYRSGPPRSPSSFILRRCAQCIGHVIGWAKENPAEKKSLVP